MLTERRAAAGALHAGPLAIALGAAGMVAAAAGVLLAGSDRSAAMVLTACLAVAWAGAGVLVTTRRRCPLAWMVNLIAATCGLGVVAWAADRHRELTGIEATIADLGQRISLALAPALAFHFLLALPDGTIRKRSHRHAVVAGYLVGAATAVALMAERDHIVGWPIAVAWAATLLAVPAASRTYRSCPVADQRRMQWIGWSIAVAAEVALVCGSLSLVTRWPEHGAEIALASTVLIPLAVAAGAVDRLVLKVDRLLTHTVSLTGLTAMVVVAYLLALAAFGRRPDDGERTLLLLSMLAAGGAALGYHPARVRLSELSNRLVYGERFSPDEALRTWGSRLTRAIPMDELLLQLVETLRKSMQLRSAQIWTGADGHLEVAAMVPHRAVEPYVVGEKEQAVVSRAGVSGGTWLEIWLPGLVEPEASARTRVAPIAHGGTLLGLIVCERSATAVSFTDEDDRVLTELARQVGLALHNVQLDTALQASLVELRDTNEELRASRVRIVAAGDSERRKLERNLHDGAQQHLVALAVQLRLAKDALADSPDEVDAMLDRLRGGLQDAIAELRALAHGIFPPLLMSGGLGEALPAAAARSALPTTADVLVGRHEQEIEAAVYFCCMEALQNAGKHAGNEASAAVRVWEDGHLLHWEVCDDGAGFDASASGDLGHGFVNMRDRMGAFGGSVDVRSSPGAGTAVHGCVPLR